MIGSSGPRLMPIDRKKWALELNLSNFVNTYYQYRDVESLGVCRNILVVGPGQGLDTAVFKWRGFNVTTYDIDETFRPDVIGSVDVMSAFDDEQFDVVIVSHVLEHLPASHLESSLQEIARVGRYALIYLPVGGRHGFLRFVAGFRDLELKVCWDLLNCLYKHNGESAVFCARQHFWELGRRGFRVKEVRVRLLKYFEIISNYRNYDWLPSYNFVLRSRNHDSVGQCGK